MKPSFTKQSLKTLLGQIRIEAEDRFQIKGQSFRVANQAPYMKWSRPMQSFGENPGDDSQKREQLVRELGNKIYTIFYTSGNPEGEWMPKHEEKPEGEKKAFMDRLTSANHTREGWDQWWSVTNSGPNGNVTVQKNGAFRTLVPNEWQPAVPNRGPLAPGSMVHLRIRKENRTVQPVFYYVYSEHMLPQGASLGRFYFNLDPHGAVGLVNGVTSLLNRFLIPFNFKCLNHLDYFARTDNAVLYIEKHRFAITARLLRRIVKELEIPLRSKTPLFARQIVPGLAYAEDPGDGRSFGMFWSELLAEGIVRAYERGMADPEGTLAMVMSRFESKGVSLEESYRKANSFIDYDFKLVKV